MLEIRDKVSGITSPQTWLHINYRQFFNGLAIRRRWMQKVSSRVPTADFIFMMVNYQAAVSLLQTAGICFGGGLIAGWQVEALPKGTLS